MRHDSRLWGRLSWLLDSSDLGKVGIRGTGFGQACQWIAGKRGRDDDAGDRRSMSDKDSVIGSQ
jgi:hypothetical protein